MTISARSNPLRDIPAAIAIFVNGVKGYAALELSRDLDVQYKTAFVLAHKLRKALAAEQTQSVIDSEAAVDGAYFGGYVKPANVRAERVDWRPKIHQTGNGACTKMAESFFSRLRRAEIGAHHRVAGRYLAAYASEMAWREDNRRVSNGEQFLMAGRATLGHPVSRQWKGYWQRTEA